MGTEGPKVGCGPVRRRTRPSSTIQNHWSFWSLIGGPMTISDRPRGHRDGENLSGCHAHLWRSTLLQVRSVQNPTITLSASVGRENHKILRLRPTSGSHDSSPGRELPSPTSGDPVRTDAYQSPTTPPTLRGGVVHIRSKNCKSS